MFRKLIGSHFRKPGGLIGRFTSNIMIRNNQAHYERIIQELDVQPHNTILEIGYGPGIGIRMIAERCATCTIHGIDFSKLMYKKASQYNASLITSGKVVLQEGNFLTMPAANLHYDKIFCLNVVYFWNELKTPFQKIVTLLKAGGSFHMYMANERILDKMNAPDSVFNRYSIDQVVKALKEAGFADVTYQQGKGFYIKAIK